MVASLRQKWRASCRACTRITRHQTIGTMIKHCDQTADADKAAMVGGVAGLMIETAEQMTGQMIEDSYANRP